MLELCLLEVGGLEDSSTPALWPLVYCGEFGLGRARVEEGSYSKARVQEVRGLGFRCRSFLALGLWFGCVGLGPRLGFWARDQKVGRVPQGEEDFSEKYFCYSIDCVVVLQGSTSTRRRVSYP